MKTIILGLGNTMRRDDGVGVVVAEEVARLAGADVATGPISGLAVLDYISGYDRVIVVDSTVTGLDKPGTVREIDTSGGGARAAAPSAPHGLGFPSVIDFGRQAGYHLPTRINLYTMAVADVFRFGDGLSDEVRLSVPKMVERILSEQFCDGNKGNN